MSPKLKTNIFRKQHVLKRVAISVPSPLAPWKSLFHEAFRVLQSQGEKERSSQKHCCLDFTVGVLLLSLRADSWFSTPHICRYFRNPPGEVG